MIDRRRLLLGLATLLVLAQPAEARTQKAKVDVDGTSYLVVLKRDGAYVASMRFIGVPSPADFERRRRAVTIATGCELANGFELGGRLAGTLVCPPGVDPTIK